MRKFSSILLLLLTIPVIAQNVSGVVNGYYPVSSFNAAQSTVSVSNSSGISIGDTVLIIQMKGAQIDVSNNDDYGDLIDLGGAGNFELIEVCDVQGNDIVFKTQLEKTYSATGLQLITYTTYQDVDVTGSVTCNSWDGNSGGVVFVRANGSVTLSSDIDVSEKGFRGGTHFYASNSCTVFSSNSDYEYDLASNLGAIKGEGVAEYTNMNCGRGALANGGGGGNDHNSGGAGGGNVTAGGNGGDNDDPGTWRCKGYFPGKGGKALDYSSGRVFLGGGGGGGHSNSSPSPYNAGNGGGIVIIMADNIIGNGGAIKANGGNGGDGIGDGGAGGGAGGSVLLLNNSFSGALNIEAYGGDGGNGDGAMSVTNTNTDRCFGPAGGGSGGFVWVNQGSLPGNLTFDLTGGMNGVVSGTTHTPCLGLAQGAEPGQDGLIAFNNQLLMGRKINSYCQYNPILDIGNDTTLCEGQTTTYSSNLSGSYTWNTGESSASISVSEAGTYLLTVDDGTYIYCDSVIVTNDAPPTFDLGTDIYLCELIPVTISAPGGYPNYLWSTGETSEEITVSNEGEIWLEIGGTYCSVSDTINIYNESFTNPIKEDVLEICSPEGVELNAGYTGGNYLWSNGEQTQIININEPIIIDVQITSKNGCHFEDEVEIIPCTDLGIPNTITPNSDGVNDTWIISQIYAFPQNSVEIYDRSGRLVYSKSGYENDWDGSGLPATVYYYSVVLDPEFDALKGTITIIRE
ncbi:MAG: gliding motility-associated C-terminal domain-containing protein [Flavobacteriales bacterium]|nr:gliding motility-associated C-terminal domain-containing protein [Flavobacteriales bacterium]